MMKKRYDKSKNAEVVRHFRIYSAVSFHSAPFSSVQVSVPL